MKRMLLVIVGGNSFSCTGLTRRAGTCQTRTAQQQLAVDVYKELVEINTVTATGGHRPPPPRPWPHDFALPASANRMSKCSRRTRKGNLVRGYADGGAQADAAARASRRGWGETRGLVG